MDKTSKLQYQQDIEKYLEEKGVYDIFEDLMKDLIINKPENPIDHLIQKLEEPEQKIIFVVGPPGSHVREYALELSNQLEIKQYDANCYSVGELLIKQIENKTDIGYEIEKSLKEFQYVSDKKVIDIVLKKLEDVKQETKNKNAEEKKRSCIILEGFPKTRVQGLALQKKGIIPSSFLICEAPNKNNNQDDILIEYCLKKLETNQKGFYSHISKEDRLRYARNQVEEYKLNIKQVKEIYSRNYFQFEGLPLSALGNINNSETDIFKKNDDALRVVEVMNDLVRFKVDYKAPRRPQRILIVSPLSNYRSQLASAISQKFGFVHISTRQLIVEQIQLKRDVGNALQASFQKGEPVQDDFIDSLLRERVDKVDARIQGYILDGFPRNQAQIEHLNQMGIKPTIVIILDARDQFIDKAVREKVNDPNSGAAGGRSADQKLKQIKEQWKVLEDLIAKHCDSSKIKKIKLSLDGENLKNIVEQISLHLDQ